MVANKTRQLEPIIASRLGRVGTHLAHKIPQASKINTGKDVAISENNIDVVTILVSQWGRT